MCGVVDWSKARSYGCCKCTRQYETYICSNLVFIISLLICFLVIFCFGGDGVQLYSLCDGPIADGQD